MVHHCHHHLPRPLHFSSSVCDVFQGQTLDVADQISAWQFAVIGSCSGLRLRRSKTDLHILVPVEPFHL